MCSKAKSPLLTTVRQCVSSLGGVRLRRARSSINIILLNMQSVCAPVCSAVLWCVFDTAHIYLVQHWYCCNAAPSFSEHTYDIPLRDALWVIFWVTGTPCCTLKGCMHSIGRLPPYWDITKSPIGRSTALTPIGRSFEIGRSKSRCTRIPLYLAAPILLMSLGSKNGQENTQMIT